MTIEWHLEKRKIKDLKPYHKNPRKITHEQLQDLGKSVTRFGLIDKPFINTDNTIIGGHQRIKLLKSMGHKEVDVYVPNAQLSAEDTEELNIRHNKNVGEWDFDILANQFEVSDLLDWGFTENELEIDIDVIKAAEEEEDTEEKKKCKTCPACGHEF